MRRFAELDDRVEIHRDPFGVPHVRARTAHDAFFGQGYVHAQDRLWQLDLQRRRAAGRLSEWFGPTTLALDVFLRRLRLIETSRSDYEAADAEARETFDAFAAGVNAFMSGCERLPEEFALLEVEPEAWLPWHSWALFKLHHVLMDIWNWKLWRARLARAFGPEAAVSLGTYDWDGGLAAVDGAGPAPADPILAELMPGIAALAALSERGGSNTWAIHGSRTATGKPLLAGDPHRSLSVPNVYYQNHVACDELDVIGISFAGVPAFPHIGHNGHVAWGVSHAVADDQDLFLERFKPGDPSRYEFRGRWRLAERHRDTIQVRGAPSLELVHTRTHHGPVVIGDPERGHALTLQFTALESPNPGPGALRRMLAARSVGELDEAMRPWVNPCNNLTMADVQGTIGYLHRGRVPIRPRANGWLPVPGWTGEHDWTGYVPFEELPRVRDPNAGFLVTANNRMAPRDYPHYLALVYEPPFRAERIAARLSELPSASIEEMASIHTDRTSIPWTIFVDAVREAPLRGELARAARGWLEGWDGRMEARSIPAAIYAALRDELVGLVAERTGAGRLGDPVVPGEPPMLAIATYLWWPVLSMSRLVPGPVFEDRAGFARAVGEALERACVRLAAHLGEDPSEWRWERLHVLRPIHPLARSFPSHAARLNPPACSVGGDFETPQMAEFHPGEDFEVGVTAVARYAFDLADWDRSQWILALGASGDPASPHYADQLPLWAEGKLVPMRYSWERIRAEAESEETLAPGA